MATNDEIGIEQTLEDNIDLSFASISENATYSSNVPKGLIQKDGFRNTY